MSQSDNIRKLEETRSAITSFISDLDARLEKKEVNGIEYHLILSEKLCGETKEEVLTKIDSKIKEIKEKEKAEQDWQKKKTIVTVSATAMIIIILAIAGILYSNPGSLTGYVVAETHTLDKTYTQYTEETLNLTNITGLKISGTLEGTGAKILLRTETGDYIITEINNTQEKNITTNYTLRTDKSTYAVGETANIIINPPTTNASLYILYAEENNILSDNNYTIDQEDNYTVRALIVTNNDIIRLETTFNAVNETTNETEQQDNTVSQETTETTTESGTTITFEDLCTQTCTISETTNPVLIIEPETNSTVTITTITTNEQQENRAPIQIKTLPDLTLDKNQEWTLNLNNYFTDPDEDPLTYDATTTEELAAEIEGKELKVSSSTTGTYEAYIYATDGKELITSNTFLITINEEEYTENNTTVNETQTEENATNETAANESIVVEMTGCSDPNPNKRPADCITGNEESYFQDKSIILENLDRIPVARVTAVGNLVIKGNVLENETSNPGPRDFRVGYTNFLETEVTVAWIDSDTGDLHLSGKLYEEQFKILPGEEAFLIQNKKGTNLGYFDKKTGDLYLRGNLISGREGVEG